jgi:hypothetical protein
MPLHDVTVHMEHPLASGRERNRTAVGHDVMHIEHPRASRVFETLNRSDRREALTHLRDGPLTASEAAEWIGRFTRNAHCHPRKLANNMLVDVVDRTLSDRGYRLELSVAAEVPVVAAPPESGRARDPENEDVPTSDFEHVSRSTSTPSHLLDPSSGGISSHEPSGTRRATIVTAA